MGAFLGHLLPGVAFLLIGLWHNLSVMYSFVSSPKKFRSRAWYPVRCRGGWQYAELYAITILSILDIIVELVVSAKLRIFVDGVIPDFRLNNLEHSSMLIMFLLYGIVALVHERTSLLPFPPGTLHLLAALAFALEYVLFAFHSTTHMGLEGHYHELLLKTIGGVLVCILVEVWRPRSFLPALTRSMALMMQGIWFIQAGASLYLDSLVAHGCWLNHNVHHGKIECSSDEAQHRAMGMANLQFAWWLFVLVIWTVVAYGLVAKRWGQELGYLPLHQDHDSESEVEVAVLASPSTQGNGKHYESIGAH